MELPHQMKALQNAVNLLLTNHNILHIFFSAATPHHNTNQPIYLLTTIYT